jgi:hypothetical protein
MKFTTGAFIFTASTAFILGTTAIGVKSDFLNIRTRASAPVIMETAAGRIPSDPVQVSVADQIDDLIVQIVMQ